MGPPKAATVLCADRDRQLCRLFEKALSGHGYRVLTAHDGRSALRLLEDERPDLAVVDLRLPGRDGFRVLEGIRRLGAGAGDTPILLMAGSPISTQDRERAAVLGATGLLAKPVSLRALVDQVSRNLKSKPPHATRRKAARAPALGAATDLEGSLCELCLPDLLHHLHGLRASGVLELTSGKKRKALQLRDGYPVAVSSNLVNECLGNLLMRRGVLTGDEMKESIQRVKKGEGLQGQILVAMELMTEEQVAAALREQAEEKLLEIFEWRQGDFEFQLGRRLSRSNRLALDASPAKLILEGVRTRLPIERVDSFIRSKGKYFVAHGASPFYRFQDIDLGSVGTKLMAGMDANRRLSDFASRGEEIRRTLYGLIVTEMVELRSRPNSGSKRSPASGPPARSRGNPSSRKRVTADSNVEDVLREELATTASKLRGQSYFEMLGVPESASDEEIEVAYEALAPRHHPDRYKNASQAVRRLADEVHRIIEQAHDTLSDPRRRRQYELERRKGERKAAREEESRRILDAELDFQKGQGMLLQRRYEDALACFGRGLQKNPGEGEYHAHYGWCLHLCHPDDVVIVQEAIEHVKRGVKLARDHEKPYLFLGRLCKVVGKATLAEKMFTRAVQIRPDCVEALRELRLINLRREKSKSLLGRLLRK